MSRKLLGYIFLGGVLSVAALAFARPVQAASGINQQINFQGRLLNAQGATVPDGFYNIEFRIYQDGDGQNTNDSTGSPAGVLKWTEDYLNSDGNGVEVRNGYLSVQLGSVTPFGTSVDWNQDTLWLSMNIAGTGTSCTPFSACSPDGEMLPMKRLSSTPYAINSRLLGGLSSAQFLQLAQGAQIDSSSNSSIFVNKTGSGNLVQLQAGGNDALTINNSGDIGLGNNANHTISVTAAASGAGKSLTVSAGGAASGSTLAGGDLILQGGAGDATAASGSVIVKSNGNNSSTAFVVQNASSTAAFTVDTANDIVQVGSATANTSPTLLILNNYNSAADPAIGYNGAMYYNTSINLFRCYQNGAWVNCAEAGGGAGAGNYVKLQSSTPGTADTGNFRISGTGIADALQGTTKTLTPLLDTPTAIALTIGTTNATGINLGNTTANIATTINGTALVKPTTGNDSATAFQVQNASSSAVFTVNTAARIVQIGSATANTNQDLLVLNNYSSATDPASGTNGAMYYNTSSNTFRCYTNGAWQDCSGAKGNFIQLGPSAVQADSSSNSSIFLNKTASGNLVQLQASGNDAFIINNSGDLTFGANGNHSISVATTAAGTAGRALTIAAGSAGSGSGTPTGGNLVLQGGAGGGANGNGGDVLLSGGAGVGTGAKGLVIISTPTFAAVTNDPNCYTGGALVSNSCTIATSSVDGNATIVVGFNTSARTAVLPAPTNKTPGRVVYVTAANGSSDFTLSVNGGGTGNEVAMRQNSSATMVWNGTAWAAAGASSSTTLQAAYDNTLQSAGGAELVVSHTSNTNGLTIRDSSTNPVNGTLLSVQTSSAATLLSINSSVTEYSSDGGAETPGGTPSTFPASTWGSVGSAAVSRYTTIGNFVNTGKASVSVATTTAANDGVKNTLSTPLTANMHYNVSFATRLSSGILTDLNVYYSPDGTLSSLVPCTVSQAVTTNIWTKVNCAFTAPASGITTSNALLIRQTAGGTARTFYVDNLSITIAADFNYATDPGVDDSANFATNWTSVSGATVSRSTTAGHDASSSARVITTGSGQGIRNKLTINPLPNTLYRVTVFVASTTTGFDNFTVRYSPDGGTSYVNCGDYNTQTITDSTNDFTEVTCYISTGATTPTSSYVYFTQTDGVGRTFYVDTFSLALTTNTAPNVQIGGGVNGGPVTLFTLDRAASAPIASNNDAFLGSMYYDTSLGKLQCYERDGWGACGSSPDNVVTISPEYTNAVMHGTGVGTMTSDICSGTLHINDGTSSQPTICAANETFNFYRWTSPQATAQTYSIYVTYQLPDTFKQFASGQTSLMGRTDSSNATVRYSIYRNDSSGLSQCGPIMPVSTGAVSSWQPGPATGAADPSTCGFSAGDSIVFKIDAIASQNANAYVGNLNFTFSNR